MQEEEEEDQEGGAGYGSGGSDLEDLEQEVPSEKEEEGVAMFSGHTPMSSGRTREKRKKKKKLTKETKELLRRQEVMSWGLVRPDLREYKIQWCNLVTSLKIAQSEDLSNS